MIEPTTSSTSLHLKASTLALLAALLVAFSFIAHAGEGHRRCDAPVQKCLDKLAKKLHSKAWLGIETEKLDGGWYKVASVHEGSPAAEAGLRAGDVLLSLDGVEINAENKDALKKAKRALAPGVTATYVVKRAGAKEKVAVTLGHLPEERIAQVIGEHMLGQHATERVASLR